MFKGNSSQETAATSEHVSNRASRVALSCSMVVQAMNAAYAEDALAIRREVAPSTQSNTSAEAVGSTSSEEVRAPLSSEVSVGA